MTDISIAKSVAGLAPYRELLHLKKIGGMLKAKCPWHDDNDPSLVVYPDAHHHCFACGANGDALDLIQQIEGLDIAAAKVRLEGYAGVAGVAGVAVAKPQIVEKPKATTPQKHVATYPYTDEKGELLFEVLRYEPKTFRQRQPKGDGWLWGLVGVRRPLYRLPEVLKADTVWLVEGEKDVEALEGLGLTATTVAGGANAKWLPEHTEALKGKKVYIIPDEDEPGRKRAEWLKLAIPDSEIVHIGAKDAADFVAAGGTREELEHNIPAPWWDRIPTLSSLEAPPITWVVPGIIPDEGLMVIAGAPGSLKSFVSLDMARRVASGQSFAGLPASEPRKVLYLDAENGASIVVARREFLATTPSPNMRYWGIFNEERIPEPNNADLLSFARAEKPLIIFDSLVRFHKGSENSNTEMAQTMQKFLDLKAVGAAVVVLHHAGKDKEKSFRGASEIEAAADVCYKTEREGESILKLVCFKNRLDREQHHWLRFSQFGFEVVEEG